jgi:formylglycine-generating enzyme required for sulfatase activity
MAAMLTGSPAASQDGRPPATESAAARAARFEAWTAAHPGLSALEQRASAETARLVDAYRQGPGRTARIESPAMVFRTRDSGAGLWDCPDCPPLVLAPAGAYTLGSPDDEPMRAKDEGPRTRVVLGRALAVGRFEVTRYEYEAFVRATHRPVLGDCISDRGHPGTWAPVASVNLRDPGFVQQDNHPVVCVNWKDAQAYVAWLGEKTGKRYRLLTEAEWEFLGRAGAETVFPWGTDVAQACLWANVSDDAARTEYPEWTGAGCDDHARRTAPVGSYRPNAFGLYDMIGNVQEWVDGFATDTYFTQPEDGGLAPGGDSNRHIFRGGGAGSFPSHTRVADRVRGFTDQVDDAIGIRVARELD